MIETPYALKKFLSCANFSFPEEEQKNTIAASSSDANPAVAKSFNEAVSAQTSFFQQQSSQEKERGSSTDRSDPNFQKNWWKKWMGN